jgi:hypothetical protein
MKEKWRTVERRPFDWRDAAVLGIFFLVVLGGIVFLLLQAANPLGP